MAQLAFLYPYAPGYQKTDTSYLAARTARHSAYCIRMRILGTLKHRAMTCEELAEVLKEEICNLRPRCSELRKQGIIEDSGLRRKNERKKKVIVWRIK